MGSQSKNFLRRFFSKKRLLSSCFLTFRRHRRQQPVATQFAVERVAADAERVGGAGDTPVVAHELAEYLRMLGGVRKSGRILGAARRWRAPRNLPPGTPRQRAGQMA